MSKKINLKTVVQNFEDAKTITKNSFILSNSKHFSSGAFGNDEALVVEHFLHLIIYISCEFYVLENTSSKLSIEKQDQISDLQGILIRQLCDELATTTNNVVALTQKMLKRVENIGEHTKDSFNKTKFITFDDKHPSHLGAFRANQKNEIPKNNILIRINFGHIFIRCGIEINDNKKNIKIIDIVNKRDA